jgi:hypothetical protein
MTQLDMFAAPVQCDGFVSRLHRAIAENHSDADLIPWADCNPDNAIAAMRSALEAEGWVWNDRQKQLERGGWYVWFRSQGRLSSPIAQWNKL